MGGARDTNSEFACFRAATVRQQLVNIAAAPGPNLGLPHPITSSAFQRQCIVTRSPLTERHGRSSVAFTVPAPNVVVFRGHFGRFTSSNVC